MKNETLEKWEVGDYECRAMKSLSAYDVTKGKNSEVVDKALRKFTKKQLSAFSFLVENVVNHIEQDRAGFAALIAQVRNKKKGGE